MRALVVGAGISGLATCLSLERQGVHVDLVERRPQVETLGSGITLIGPALRALQMLGVYDDCVAQGFGITDFQTYNADGTLASTFRLPSPVGTDQPGMLGMMRPTLHSILLQHVRREGTSIRTGVAPTGIVDGTHSTTVTFDSGERNEYDLVVGADGVRSTVRELVLGPTPLVFAGQATVRVVLPRPSEVMAEIQFHPVNDVFIGFTPTAADRMYMYCSFPAHQDDWPSPTEVVALTREKTEPFGGLVKEVRDDIAAPRQVNFTKFDTVIIPSPWGHGRTVIVGDAAHCPPPQLAAGAAMCLEDAVALGQELQRAAGPEQALQNFASRRYERCAFVVHTARQLSHWQTYPGTGGNDHVRVTTEAFELLAQPF